MGRVRPSTSARIVRHGAGPNGCKSRESHAGKPGAPRSELNHPGHRLEPVNLLTLANGR